MTEEAYLECPLCGVKTTMFLPFGHPPRKNAQCPRCGSLERHRLAGKYLKDVIKLKPSEPLRLLHFAPEEPLTKYFKSFSAINYLSVDIEKGRAMWQEDIRNLGFGDNTFDAIYCSHVLEHIDDDRKAMRELRRVLKKSGWALIAVPQRTEHDTLEDLTITDPAERTRLYGQHDHVRYYGLDFPERLEEVGFQVDTINYYDDLSPEERNKYSVLRSRIFICRKGA